MKIITSLIVVASIVLNAFLAYRIWDEPPKTMTTQSSDSMIVMRTRGGLLEVSTINSQEQFNSTTSHTILGAPIGKTVAHIRIPAVYRYHIPLARDWTLRSSDRTLIVIAPPVQPSLPVAVDTGKLESFSSGIWSPVTGTNAIASLQKVITQNLSIKAGKSEMLMLQRESARKTVTEFVQKWVVDQPQWKGTKTPIVLAFFEDEPLGARTAALLVP
jgi:hypothetical protein